MRKLPKLVVNDYKLDVVANAMVAFWPISISKTLKFHDGDEPLSHIRQLTKVCVTNIKNIDPHVSIFSKYFKMKSCLLVCSFQNYKPSNNMANDTTNFHFTFQ